jgi:hypothetical protein
VLKERLSPETVEEALRQVGTRLGAGRPTPAGREPGLERRVQEAAAMLGELGGLPLGIGSYKHYLRVELEDINAWISFSNISCNGQVVLSFGLPAGCDLGGGGFADQRGTTFEAEDTLDDCHWNWNAFFKAD